MSARWNRTALLALPSAGRPLPFGDMEAILDALDLDALDRGTGKELWSTKLGGTVGDCRVGAPPDRRRIAVGSGTRSPRWPVPEATERTVGFGLAE